MAILVTAWDAFNNLFTPLKSRKRLKREAEEDAEAQVCEYRPQQRRRMSQTNGLGSSANREWREAYCPQEDPQVSQNPQQRPTGVQPSPYTNRANRLATSPLQPLRSVTPREEQAYLRGYYGARVSMRPPHDQLAGLSVLPHVAGGDAIPGPQLPVLERQLTAKGQMTSPEDGAKVH